MDFLHNDLPDKCAQLLICDPPYFEVKGAFDFIWSSFDAYLADVEKWAVECKRLLADNGTLFWYGSAKNIAYAQVIFDKHFNLENSIAIELNRQTKKGVDSFRCFAPVSERLLMYSNEVIRTGLETIKLDTNNFKGLREYFKDLQSFIGLGLKGINAKLGHRRAEHSFYHSTTQWDMPTLGVYQELILCFDIDKWSDFREYEALRGEYEALRGEYEALRRPFNNTYRLFDIMKFDQESHVTRHYDHDTVKPEKLTRALILTCSRPGDLVVVPFAGSGTECAMAVKEGRRAWGCDIEAKYCQMANQRIGRIMQAPALSFAP